MSGLYSEYSKVVNFARVSIIEARGRNFFTKDMDELEVTVDVVPFVYPLPARWKRARYIKVNNDTTIPYIPPGENAISKNLFYYQGLSSLAFSGVAVGDIIKIAYYTHPKVFNYYHALGSTENPTFTAGVLPAYFDAINDSWLYLYTDGNGVSSYISTLGTDILNTAAQNLVADWLIIQYPQMLLQGILTKIHRERSDQPRASFAYSLYQNLLSDFLQQEGGTPLGQLS